MPFYSSAKYLVHYTTSTWYQNIHTYFHCILFRKKKKSIARKVGRTDSRFRFIYARRATHQVGTRPNEAMSERLVLLLSPLLLLLLPLLPALPLLLLC